MTEHSVSETVPEGVPAPPPDDENPALIDAKKTYQITMISSVLFMLSALFFILRTRMG